MDYIRTTATFTTGATSISSLIVSCITQNNIAWSMGILAGCATIFTAYLAYRKDKRDKAEKAMNIENLSSQRDYYREKLRNIMKSKN